MREVLRAVLDRCEAYAAGEVSRATAPGDIMFDANVPGALDHYLAVGRSAIEVIATAMIMASRKSFATILDLPSGAGRVTRHLRRFFPEAHLFVAELNREDRDFAAATFGATIFESPASFEVAPARRFDLIFAGSLVTHFDEAFFRRTLAWFIDALEEDGLLVLTLHGRQHDQYQRNLHHFVPAEDWEHASADFRAIGFGFAAFAGSPAYGNNLVAPSWVMRLVERDPSVRVLGFQEAAWSNHQDCLILQKRGFAPGAAAA